MLNMDKTKISKSYSWNREVVAWLVNKAARETLVKGKQISASEIANSILEEAMLEDRHVEKIKEKIEPKIHQTAKR